MLTCLDLKGYCHEIFDLKFFQIFAEIFSAQGVPPLVVDASGKWKKSTTSQNVQVLKYGITHIYKGRGTR